jgi:hypothetical protein
MYLQMSIKTKNIRKVTIIFNDVSKKSKSRIVCSTISLNYKNNTIEIT